MITANGVTWTDKAETLDFVDKLEASGPILKPVCEFTIGDKKRGCGRTTCFMVLNDSYQEKKKHWWVWLMQGGIYKIDGLILIPVKECGRCSAGILGYQVGFRNPEGRETEIDFLKTAPMTPEEAEEFRNIYYAAYSKGRDKAIKAIKDSPKNKSRYQMK